MIRDVDLEGRHPGQRPRRRPDLGREVRQGGEVVAKQRRGVGEAIPGELHAISGITGKPDHSAIKIDNHLLTRCGIGHVSPFKVLKPQSRARGVMPHVFGWVHDISMGGRPPRMRLVTGVGPGPGGRDRGSRDAGGRDRSGRDPGSRDRAAETRAAETRAAETRAAETRAAETGQPRPGQPRPGQPPRRRLASAALRGPEAAWWAGLAWRRVRARALEGEARRTYRPEGLLRPVWVGDLR